MSVICKLLCFLYYEFNLLVKSYDIGNASYGDDKPISKKQSGVFSTYVSIKP